MADADFYLGANDTGPVLEMICLGPDGLPVDLTGALVTFMLRLEDESAPVYLFDCDVKTPGSDGAILVNWGGYAAGRYEGRAKVVLSSGVRMSFPNYRPLKIVITEDP